MRLQSLVIAAVLSCLSVFSAQAAEEKATFAGGCFWCMEPPFDKLEGVISTTSGYMGGTLDNPTYEQVTYGKTGHLEVVQVVYDPQKVSYEKLLETYWVNIDHLNFSGQFCDNGESYTTAIFTHGETQKASAEASLAKIADRFSKPIATRVVEAPAFWPAEDYHQDFYLKNPGKYKYYRTGCGRDRRLNQLWGDQPPY